jgi:hypothetical protein
MTNEMRDRLGRVAHEALVRWAATQPDPNPWWAVPYEDLPESSKEADRIVGEAVVAFMTQQAPKTIDPKFLTTISPGEFGEDLMP